MLGSRTGTELWACCLSIYFSHHCCAWGLLVWKVVRLAATWVSGQSGEFPAVQCRFAGVFSMATFRCGVYCVCFAGYNAIASFLVANDPFTLQYLCCIMELWLFLVICHHVMLHFKWWGETVCQDSTPNFINAKLLVIFSVNGVANRFCFGFFGKHYHGNEL